jgi:hypothetical protein
MTLAEYRRKFGLFTPPAPPAQKSGETPPAAKPPAKKAVGKPQAKRRG